MTTVVAAFPLDVFQVTTFGLALRFSLLRCRKECVADALSSGYPVCSFPARCPGARISHVKLSATGLSRTAHPASRIYLCAAYHAGICVDGKYEPANSRNQPDYPSDSGDCGSGGTG